jgi:enoyl-CoA hydratase/carnithine racemase
LAGLVEVSVDDSGVALLQLNRPEARNALSPQMREEIAASLERLDSDPEVRCVVIAGSDEFFAAGADIKAMVGYGPDEIGPDVGALERACRDLEAIPKPVIAAINGFALGGGLEVALACDFRVASQDARLGLPEIRLGIIPGSGGTQRLPRLVGLARARDLVFSGRHLTADEALAIGLVDGVAPAGDAHTNAYHEASVYAQGPTLAYAAAKRALAAAGDRRLAEGLEVEREVFVPLFATSDQEEGMRAFLEKRNPEFEGR